MIIEFLCLLGLSQCLQSTASFMEHSYLARISNAYLTYERLQFYQEQGYFQSVCPRPSPIDRLILPDLFAAYAAQEREYLTNEKFQERASALGTLEKLFGKIAPPQEKQPPKKEVTVQSSIADFYNKNYEFRELYTLNIHMKSRPLVTVLFVLLFAIVTFRLSKRSEQSRQRVLWTFSVLWVCAVLQLYFELNWLSLEPQPRPYSKVLFLGLLPFDQVSSYIPEIMNLLLFVVCLFYFFSLVFRFQDIFGSDEFVEALPRQVQKQTKKAKQGQGSHKEEELLLQQQQQQQQHMQDDSEDDFSLNGLATQPIVQLTPISVRTVVELYHFVVIHVVVFVTFLKVSMLFEGLLFVRLNEYYSVCTMDNLEVFPLTPRYLALFTVSFLQFSEYIGKTSMDATQHNFQKGCPFLIAALHTVIVVMRRRYLFTIDDVFIAMVFLASAVQFLGKDQKTKNPVKKSTLLSKNATSYNETEERKEPRPYLDKKQDLYEGEAYSDEDSQSETQQFLTNLIEEVYADKLDLKTAQSRKLVDKLARQLREMTEEDAKKLFAMGNDFENCSDEDLIKLELLEQLKISAASFQQKGQQQTQGGQGQQINYNAKQQTAHKTPTKAPSGRPNPRKRR